MANRNYPQLQPFYLHGSGGSVGDVTLKFQSLTSIDAAFLAMTDFGLKGYMTLQPNEGSGEEQISFTGLTQNVDGTATISGVSSVGLLSPYTETSGLSKPHPGGAKCVVSVSSGFLSGFANKFNDETITGKWVFPTYTSSDIHQVATIEYVNAIAVAGSPNASTTVKGIVQDATTAQINAGTATGSTGATLAVTPDALATSNYATQLPSSDQKAALAGTSGTPSASNKYVTNDDTTGTGSVVRSSLVLFFSFGDGSDGDVTISTPTTLTRDMYYNSLNLNDDLNAAGFRIFVKGTLTVASGKKIYNNGGNGGNGGNASSGTPGIAGTAGTAASAGSLPAGLAGKAGAAGANNNSAGNAGTAGSAQVNALNSTNGSDGGKGGNSSSGNTGGAKGSGGTTTITASTPKNITQANNLVTYVAGSITAYGVSASGGSGGSGASSNGSNAVSAGGGGSGASGGMIFLSAKTIVLNGSSVWLQAIGGNGGNGGTPYCPSGTTTGGSGGGAGGNGGVVILIKQTMTGTATISVAGGTKGSGSNGAGDNPATFKGDDGVDGSAGTIYLFDISA